MNTLTYRIGLPIQRPITPLPLRRKVSYPKAMTIALGMLTTDGIIVAADTQVGIENYLKNSRGKIAGCSATTIHGDFNFSITGAGSAADLSALQIRLVEWFHEEISKNGDGKSIETALQSKIKEFHTEHVLPFEGMSSCPDFWLILALCFGERKFLWYTEKNLLVPALQTATVGAGSLYAQILINKLYQEVDSETGALLAAYIIHQVKAHIDSCGHDTDIFIIRSSTTRFTDRMKLRRLGDVFDGYSEVESKAFHQVIGSVVSDHLDGASILKELDLTKKRIQDIFNRAKPPDPQSPKADLPDPQPSLESPEG